MIVGLRSVRIGRRFRQQLADALVRATCADCGKAIERNDDPALVCIPCGGRNRRIVEHQL